MLFVESAKNFTTEETTLCVPLITRTSGRLSKKASSNLYTAFMRIVYVEVKLAIGTVRLFLHRELVTWGEVVNI